MTEALHALRTEVRNASHEMHQALQYLSFAQELDTARCSFKRPIERTLAACANYERCVRELLNFINLNP